MADHFSGPTASSADCVMVNFCHLNRHLDPLELQCLPIRSTPG